MIITFQYRLKPTPEQVATMSTWNELLRRHWNFALGQRLDWLRQTRCQIDRCSILSCPIGEVPTPVEYYYQQSALKETKQLFPAYKDIYSEVQQMNLQKLDKAWKRWLFPNKTGKRGGCPRFKKRGEKPAFSFSRVNQPKAVCFLEGSYLRIPKIGNILIVVHRPIPEGFTLKTATICCRADGWYVSISMADETVPELVPLDDIKSAVGVDVGLKEFLTTSNGATEPVQQNFRHSQKRLARQQRSIARMLYGSKNSLKQKNRVARIHQRVKRQRKEFHYKVAHKLVKAYDLIGVEDLNIRGLARTKLAKSILDAAWGEFITILETVARSVGGESFPRRTSLVRRGVRVVKVRPHGTTTDCSNCGWKVPKTLEVRIHDCPQCLTVLDRDHNAAINILVRAIAESCKEGFPPGKLSKTNAVGLTVSACGGKLSLDDSACRSVGKVR